MHARPGVTNPFVVLDLPQVAVAALLLERALAWALGVAAGLAIVVLTGYARIAMAVEALKLGARHCLVKPANTDDIEAASPRGEGETDIDLTQRATSIKTQAWERLHETLAEANFNIGETAGRLGMHRRTPARKLQQQRVK